MTSTYSRIGRVVTAAVIAAAGAALALGWRRRHPTSVPVVRCPIHGVAYDAELEICPDCAKTQAVQPFVTTGGAR